MATIIIVDDAPDIIQILGFVLKKQGHQVLTALSGEEAMEKSVQQTIQFAFVDFNLPDTTGPELTVKLRQQFPHIKVILLSGQEGVDAASVGVDAFMLKPFTADQIKAVLNSLI